MCVYGGDDAGHFEAALRSVAEQTVRPSEIVLTVDGPIPAETEAVIQRFRQALAGSELAFRVFYLEKNCGHGKARQLSLSNCSCELVAVMDADDLSVPDRFEKQLAFFARRPELSAVGGVIREFTGSPEHCVGTRTVPTEDAEIKAYMKKRCPMNQMTVMFRRADVDAVGGYLDWYCEEDYYLWIRLALAGYQFGNLPENLVNVRVDADTYRRRGGLRYFRSEARLQRYMRRHGMIGWARYALNVTERLILQVLMPNRLRGFVFRKLARS